MFVIKKSQDITIEWPVVVELPVSGGNIRKFEFTGIFERLAETELESLRQLATEALEEEKSSERRRPNIDALIFFSHVLKGWKNVQDEAGQPVEYSPEALETALLGNDGLVFAIALWRAHGQLRAGAKAKN